MSRAFKSTLQALLPLILGAAFSLILWKIFGYSKAEIIVNPFVITTIVLILVYYILYFIMIRRLGIALWVAFFCVSIYVALPWSTIDIPNPRDPTKHFTLSEYKLGLDLHGGVELDYLVDFTNLKDPTAVRKTQIIEDMKTILDGRVRRIGTTEPVLNTAMYGNETHIIVQIPTPSSHDKLGPAERKIRDAEFIQEAKSVIGKVVKIQFKEPRSTEEKAAAKASRPNDLEQIAKSFTEKTIPFDAWGQKIADSYENVFLLNSTQLTALVGKDPAKEVITLGDLTTLFATKDIEGKSKEYTGKISTINIQGQVGTGYVVVESLGEDILSATTPVKARLLYIAKAPLDYKPALGKNGKILDEQFLINTLPTPDQTTGQYVVNLIFNTEGQTMFGDITERNIGGNIAIYLGNQLLTAPRVSTRIDGNAIITSGGETDSRAWAKQLSKGINEGIVPVGIYEHSEQTIGPNLGRTSLNALLLSGLIGLIVICAFLLWRYGISGIVAAFSLVIYIIILLALVRFMGVTMTLSGVAGIVLSIGIAIDSNILLLERVGDFVKQGKDIHASLRLGFREAWSAVWDSNLTGLLVGLILWWMGVSLVKGFGQMTVLGIVVSLLVVRYICNPFTIWLREKIDR